MVGNEREYILERFVFYDILNFEAVFVNYKGIFLPFFKSQTINYRNIKIIKIIKNNATRYADTNLTFMCFLRLDGCVYDLSQPRTLQL